MKRFALILRKTGVFGAALVVVAALPAQAEPQRVVPESVVAMKQSFAPVVKRATPAVVNISSSRVEKVSANPFMSDPFFRQFFGDMMPQGIPREQREHARAEAETGGRMASQQTIEDDNQCNDMKRAVFIHTELLPICVTWLSRRQGPEWQKYP